MCISEVPTQKTTTKHFLKSSLLCFSSITICTLVAFKDKQLKLLKFVTCLFHKTLLRYGHKDEPNFRLSLAIHNSTIEQTTSSSDDSFHKNSWHCGTKYILYCNSVGLTWSAAQKMCLNLMTS